MKKPGSFLFKSPASALLLFFMTWIVYSCGPIVYAPVGQNAPLFQKSGEIAISAGVDKTLRTTGLSAQAAVAVSNRLMIISSLYTFDYGGSDNNSPTNRNHGTYYEMGAGRFKYNSRIRLCTEIVAGVGFGSISNSYGVDFADLKYTKPFIQGSGGFSVKNFEAAFTTRIGLVSYQSRSASPSQQADLDEFFSKNQNTFVFEPGWTSRVGFGNVKVQMQVTYTTFCYRTDAISLNSAYFLGYDYQNPLFVSLGLFVLISKRRTSDL